MCLPSLNTTRGDVPVRQTSNGCIEPSAVLEAFDWSPCLNLYGPWRGGEAHAAGLAKTMPTTYYLQGPLIVK
jgi:hypothetical protein